MWLSTVRRLRRFLNDSNSVSAGKSGADDAKRIRVISSGLRRDVGTKTSSSKRQLYPNVGPDGYVNEREVSAGGFDSGLMRGQADMSLTEAARGGFASYPYAVVGHIELIPLRSEREPYRCVSGLRMPNDVGQQLASHSEQDGVDGAASGWVIDVGDDRDA